MQCDKCGSDNTQRLEVVFENGTSNINTRSHSAGVGVGGTFGVGGVTTKTTGTSQTTLGGKAAPPPKKSYKWAIISILFGLIFWNANGDMSAMILGGLLMAAGAYFIYVAASYNKNKWPILYRYWQESWLCHKCGNIYHHA